MKTYTYTKNRGAPEASAAAPGTAAAPTKAATQAATTHRRASPLSMAEWTDLCDRLGMAPQNATMYEAAGALGLDPGTSTEREFAIAARERLAARFPRAPWPDPEQFDPGLAKEVRARFRASLGDNDFSVESRPFNDEARDRHGHKVIVLRSVAPRVIHKWGVIGDIPGIQRWMNETTLEGARVPEGCAYMQFWDADPYPMANFREDGSCCAPAPLSPPADIPEKSGSGDIGRHPYSERFLLDSWRRIAALNPIYIASPEPAVGVTGLALARSIEAAGPPSTSRLTRSCPNTGTPVPSWLPRCTCCAIRAVPVFRCPS